MQQSDNHINLSKLQEISCNEIQAIKKLDIDLGEYPISPNETMKWKGGDENYFFHAKSAIQLIDSILRLTCRDKSRIGNVLDFPCGHGRVLRGLKTYFAGSKIYACDLDKKGVDFCASTLGAIGVYSDVNLDKVSFDAKFDLIWCGSLLTHVNADEWDRFFDFFNRVLHVNGLLVFTYAGHFVKELVKSGDHNFIDESEAKKALKSYHDNGFGFMQYNTHSHEYGRTICTPSWVVQYLNKLPSYRTVLHYERGWGARQDVVAILKEA